MKGKKMKKSIRILSIALAAFMLLSLAALTACKNDPDDNSPAPSANPSANSDKDANSDKVTPAPTVNPGAVQIANWGIDSSKTLVTIVYGGNEYPLNSSYLYNAGVSSVGNVATSAGKNGGRYEGTFLKYALSGSGIDLDAFSANSVTLYFADGTSKDITGELSGYELLACLLSPSRDSVAVDPANGIYFVLGIKTGTSEVLAYSNVLKIEIH